MSARQEGTQKYRVEDLQDIPPVSPEQERRHPIFGEAIPKKAPDAVPAERPFMRDPEFYSANTVPDAVLPGASDRESL